MNLNRAGLCAAAAAFFLVFFNDPAQAGANCLARTLGGALIELEIVTAGSSGGLQNASVIIRDARGEILATEEFTPEQVGQYGQDRTPGRKAVIVFSAKSESMEVRFVFQGDESDLDRAGRIKLLVAEDRKAVRDGSLHVSFRGEGGEREMESTNIAVMFVYDSV